MSIGKVLLLASLFLSSSQAEEPEVCPLCANATHSVYSYGTFLADSGIITCDEAFEKELRLPPENVRLSILIK
jgi:hypothetical protein